MKGKWGEQKGARGKRGRVSSMPDVTVNALTSFCMWHLINMARAHKQNGGDSFICVAPLKACNVFCCCCCQSKLRVAPTNKRLKLQRVVNNYTQQYSGEVKHFFRVFGSHKFHYHLNLLLLQLHLRSSTCCSDIYCSRATPT